MGALAEKYIEIAKNVWKNCRKNLQNSGKNLRQERQNGKTRKRL